MKIDGVQGSLSWHWVQQAFLYWYMSWIALCILCYCTAIIFFSKQRVVVITCLRALEHSFIIVIFLYKKNTFSEIKDTSNNYLERYYITWNLLTLLCRCTKFPVLFLCIIGKQFIYRKSSNCYWSAVNLPLNIGYKRVNSISKECRCLCTKMQRTYFYLCLLKCIKKCVGDLKDFVRLVFWLI